MTTTSKIARVSFAALAVFVGIEPVHAQWTGGPVLIGGAKKKGDQATSCGRPTPAKSESK